MIDRNIILGFTDGNSQLAEKMILAFRETVLTCLPKLLLAIHSKDLKQIENMAHILKSQALYMGLGDLSDLFRALELNSQSLSNSEQRLLMDKIQDQVSRIFEEEGWSLHQ